jgi:transcription initiation factor TFIID subunit 1
MQRDPLNRLKYSLLAKVFNFYTEAEIRNKIKEYLVYAKKGENTGWWKLNPKLTFPNEEGIRKIITPEMACLMESSLVGQQRLNDAGYGSLLLNENEEGLNEDEDATLDMEIRMAPWTGSKNFTLAAQGKGMIALYGPGDPTGCGEAFSFVRASMKEMFFMEGHSDATKAAFLGEKARTTYHRFSIIDQQQVYKSEIKRIWNNQLRSLMPIPEDKKRTKMSSMNNITEIDENADQKIDASSPLTNLKDQETASDNEDTQSNATSNFLAGKNKILVINRLVNIFFIILGAEFKFRGFGMEIRSYYGYANNECIPKTKDFN